MKFNYHFFVSLLCLQVVQHCVSCLGAVVNKVTHNYKFVWACFNRFYGELYSKCVLYKLKYPFIRLKNFPNTYELQFEC